MTELTAFVIETLGYELCVRDWQEQRQFFRDIGVLVYKWETEGICDIDAGTLINFVCEHLIPIEGGSLLKAICNDIEWGEVEAFIKQEVDSWWASRVPEEEPAAKRVKRE